jgi:biotin synthase-related radical SAM superfamily protein
LYTNAVFDLCILYLSYGDSQGEQITRVRFSIKIYRKVQKFKDKDRGKEKSTSNDKSFSDRKNGIGEIPINKKIRQVRT